MNILLPEFFERPTLTVARELLGKRLVRILDGMRLSGFICETEAYIGELDLACHARSGKTKRNGVMYGPAGRAYVYFTYGNHWMLNAVTESEGYPAAVLLRGFEPIEGIEMILQRRNGRDAHGPGKLTQALGIDGAFNGASLSNVTRGLWIEEGETILDEMLETGPRVGLFTVPEPWKSRPWRYRIKSDIHLACRES